MNGQNIESGWIFPKYYNDRNAADFVSYLMDNSEFGPDEATGGAVWHDPIPERSEWAERLASHNKSYRQGQMWECDRWADACESSGPNRF